MKSIQRSEELIRAEPECIANAMEPEKAITGPTAREKPFVDLLERPALARVCALDVGQVGPDRIFKNRP